VYSPSSGVVVPAGRNLLSATFTPFDTANFASQTVSASLDVITPVDITGAQGIGWDQPIIDGVAIEAMRFAIYLDGARSELPGVSCTASGSSGVTCSAHRLSIA
jgi:hypothetical protein